MPSALSEPLFIFLSLLAFWMFDLYHERDAHWLWLVACGALVGAGLPHPLRGAGAGVPPLWWPCSLCTEGWRRRLTSVGIFLAGLLPWMVGWAIRNAVVGGTRHESHSRLASDHGSRTSTPLCGPLAGFLVPVEAWRQALVRVHWPLPTLALLVGLGIGSLARDRPVAGRCARSGRTRTTGSPIAAQRPLHLRLPCVHPCRHVPLRCLDEVQAAHPRPGYVSLLVLLVAAGRLGVEATPRCSSSS